MYLPTGWEDADVDARVRGVALALGPSLRVRQPDALVRHECQQSCSHRSSGPPFSGRRNTSVSHSAPISPRFYI